MCPTYWSSAKVCKVVRRTLATGAGGCRSQRVNLLLSRTVQIKCLQHTPQPRNSFRAHCSLLLRTPGASQTLRTQRCVMSAALLGACNLCGRNVLGLPLVGVDCWFAHLQVTINRVAALYYAPYETSSIIRGGPLARCLFNGTRRSEGGSCDLSIRVQGCSSYRKPSGEAAIANGIAYGRCLLLFTVQLKGQTLRGAFIRWFTSDYETSAEELADKRRQPGRRPGNMDSEPRWWSPTLRQRILRFHG